MSKNPPVEVQEYGQSIWYDNISRKLLQDGEIQRLVDEDGVLGITSNPTIFENAIAASSIYDSAIAQNLNSDTNSIFEALAIDDIRAAADILYPVYERTQGVDGYISLEVSPLIANDTQTTIQEAERLFKLVDRPNLMIKIPATDAGLPAIEASIAKGININVTLIFSVEYYKKVVEAYLSGLEKLHQAGGDLSKVSSVASFFLSRIDTLVDQQLQSNVLAAQGRDIDRVSANRQLFGKAAIANAKLAYLHFKSAFGSERFEKLRQAGAKVQRPLWASTGTKNPAYPDTLYIDTLIGPDTVNTVPASTLKAFKDHGTVAASLEQNINDAHHIMQQLEEVGIDMEMVTRTLQIDGVEKFVASFNNLMDTIEGKRQMLSTGLIDRQAGILGAYQRGVREDLHELSQAPRHIWNKNAEWWKDDIAHQESIKNRLGWLTVVSDGSIDRKRLAILRDLAREWEYVVLLGMGGSSLAPEVLAKTFGLQTGFPELFVLDSTVPAAVQGIEKKINLAKTLFVVASKSGTTIETAVMFDYFYQKVLAIAEDSNAGDHFVIITDPGSKLIEQGRERKVSEIFENPADIGGRYSALSYFGLVPAALIGLDLNRLYDSAEKMEAAIHENVPPTGNPALILGVILGSLAKAGRDKATIISSPQIETFGNWVEQLVAESTGKEGHGIVPVVGATVGMPHDYDDDRLIIYLRLDGENAELDEHIRLLTEAGHPVYTIHLQDAYALGGEFLRWEFATAVAGKFFGINPFDEPDVTSAKKITNEFLKRYQEVGKLSDEKAFFTEDNVSLYVDDRIAEMLSSISNQCHFDSSQLEGLLAAHISLARSGNYIGLLAYLASSPENHEALENIRRRLRHATKRAVTLGYGPRYLHSTGQLHKGGPNEGVFIQITVDDEAELPIPGKPYSFSILKQAQALGELQALRERKRRVVRLHISGDIEQGLQKISKAIEAAEAKII